MLSEVHSLGDRMLHSMLTQTCPMQGLDLRDWTFENTNIDGEIQRSIPVVEVFLNSGYEGLLYVSDKQNPSDRRWGDRLHENDIDTLPEGMEVEVFETGERLAVFDGSDPGTQFLGQIKSVDQRLENGSELIVVAGDGRLLECSADKKLAWRDENQPDEGLLRSYWAEVLPPELDEIFSKRLN